MPQRRRDPLAPARALSGFTPGPALLLRGRGSLAALGAFDLPQQQVGELNDLGCLDGVVEVDGAVAGGILVRAHSTGEQRGGGFLFTAFGSGVGERSAGLSVLVRLERCTHQLHADQGVVEAGRVPDGDFTAFIAAKHAVS